MGSGYLLRTWFKLLEKPLIRNLLTARANAMTRACWDVSWRSPSWSKVWRSVSRFRREKLAVFPL